MRFKVFKNTVLLFVLVVISCAGKGSNETLKNEQTNEILKQVQNDKSIVVGANRTEVYLPLLKGKRVGVVANQTSVIFRETRDERQEIIDYTHLVDSLLALNIIIKKVFSILIIVSK